MICGNCCRAAWAVALSFTAALAFAQAKGKPAAQAPKPKPPANQVKGQAQQKGGPGVFGETYSLKSGWNFTIEGASYSVAPENELEATTLGPKQKYLVLRARIKNARPVEMETPEALEFSLVDAGGQSEQHFMPATRLSARKPVGGTLKPGQGIDDLKLYAPVAADARIVKFILNQGRLNVPGEEVIRYFVAGSTEAEAGGKADPKNVVAPVPDPFRDPADAKGATALENAPARIGTAYLMGLTFATLERVSTAARVGEQEAEEGRQFMVLHLKLKNAWSGVLDAGEGLFGNGLDVIVIDGDGEETRGENLVVLKAARDEPVGPKKMQPGEEYAVRVAVSVPKIGKSVKRFTVSWGGAASHGLVYEPAP